jgi:hypothetical protein
MPGCKEMKRSFRLVVLAALPLLGIGQQIDDATRRQYDEILWVAADPTSRPWFLAP